MAHPIRSCRFAQADEQLSGTGREDLRAMPALRPKSNSVADSRLHVAFHACIRFDYTRSGTAQLQLATCNWIESDVKGQSKWGADVSKADINYAEVDKG